MIATPIAPASSLTAASVDADSRHCITCGAFLDLFPEVGAPPALIAA